MTGGSRAFACFARKACWIARHSTPSKQWRYSPVLLNGQPEKFILTVVVSFKLEDT